MARSVSFSIHGVFDALTTVTEIEDGALLFKLEAQDVALAGDLSAIFFNLSDLIVDSALSIAGDDVTGQAFGEGSVSGVGRDADSAFTEALGRFDVGVAFGTPGAGRAEISSTSFVLSHKTVALSLDMLNPREFALRYASADSAGGDGMASAATGDAAPDLAPEAAAPAAPSTLKLDWRGRSLLQLLDGEVLATIALPDGGKPVDASDLDGVALGAVGVDGRAFTLTNANPEGLAVAGLDSPLAVDQRLITQGEFVTVSLTGPRFPLAAGGVVQFGNPQGYNRNGDLDAGEIAVIRLLRGGMVVFEGSFLNDGAASQDSVALDAFVDAEGRHYTGAAFDTLWIGARDNPANAAAARAGDRVTELTLRDITLIAADPNDPPAIAPAEVALAFVEDTPGGAQGAFLLSDPDLGDTLTLSVDGVDGLVRDGVFGTLTLDVDGRWSYAYDSTREAAQALAQGATGAETFTVRVTDAEGASAEATVAVAVAGANDAPTISPASVSTGLTPFREDTSGAFNGQFAVSDVDAGAALTLSVGGQSLAFGTGGGAIQQNGTYGVLTLNADGSWRYDYDATRAASQALQVGVAGVGRDEFQVTVTDEFGAADVSTIRMGILGANDAPVISPASVTTGLTPFREDTSGTFTGQFAISDVDAGATLTLSVGGQSLPVGTGGGAIQLDGLYGVLTLNADGSWRYDYDATRAASQALQIGVAGIGRDDFQVTVTDEFGATDISTIRMSVLGANDAPVIQQSSVVSGLAFTNGTGTATGQLAATDVDAGDTLTWAVSGSGAGQYGTFSVDAATGLWTYALDPDAIAPRLLPPGQALTETFTAVVSDVRSGTDDVSVAIDIAYDTSVFTATFRSSLSDTAFSGLEGDTYVLGSATVPMSFAAGDYARIEWSPTEIAGFLEEPGSFGGDSAGVRTVLADLGFGNDAIVFSPSTLVAAARAAGDVDTIFLLGATGSATTGADLLIGADGDDVLSGDVNQIASASGGALTLTFGDDVIDAGGGADSVTGDVREVLGAVGGTLRGGDDLLLGGAGDDTISGDFPIGGMPFDVTAFGGNDTIIGGAGNDVLLGDGRAGGASLTRGADLFVFEPGSGFDRILDFDPSDRIDLSAYGITGLNGLSIFSVSGGALIDLDGSLINQDQIFLADVTPETLTAEVFIFA